MDTTPRSKVRKLSCRKTEPEIDAEEPEPWAPSQSYLGAACTSTPPNKKGSIQFEHDNESPMYFPLTQDGSDEMDVVWDWNSPQENKRKRQRRILRPLSPIVPIKRHPSSSQTLEKLEMELRALREQLAESFDETLHVSPHQEEEILQSQNKVVVEDKELDVMFDDSLDDQLLQCSQQVESQFLTEKTSNVRDSTVLSRNNALEGSLLCTLQNQTTKKPLTFQRTRSNEQYSKPQSKVEFNRTRSFEEPVKNSTVELPKEVLDQIEKKKLEALARLEAKRKNSVPVQQTRTEIQSNALAHKQNVKVPESAKRQEHTSNAASYEEIGRKALLQQSSHQKFPSNISTIPSAEGVAKNLNWSTKCSLEEIEKKRLQALAKRQANGNSSSAKTNAETITPIVTNRFDTSARLASMKCSPEEIEKKRLQALARREEKKIQDLIERKRQEALKRLQLNKQKQSKHV